MGKSNKIIKAVAIYQLATALVCLFFLFVGVIQNTLNNVIAISAIAISSIFITVTILTNIQILVYHNRLKSHYFTVNALVCLVQCFHLFSDGFYYKYLQGFGLIGYIAIVNATKQVLSGLFFSNVTLELMFKFDESNSTLIGINFIALALTFYFYWLSKNIGQSNK